MTYDIFKRTAPAMPKPQRGLKFIFFILSKASKASKDMQKSLLPMVMSALSARLTDIEFLHSDGKYYPSDGKYYPMCGQMGLVSQMVRNDSTASVPGARAQIRFPQASPDGREKIPVRKILFPNRVSKFFQ